MPRGLGARLSPVHFRRPAAQGVSFYALLRGWGLLFLPPPCLCRGTAFRALRRDFGALASVSVVPVSARELTPRSPSPAIYGAATFGVRRGPPGFHTGQPPSVTLPRRLPPAGLAWGATSAGTSYPPCLIGLSPLPRAHGIGLSPRTPSGPPPSIRWASPWPGVDRRASGLVPAAPRPFRRRPSPRRSEVAGLSLSLRLRPQP